MKNAQKNPMTETKLRRLLARYHEAKALKAKAYALDPYGYETWKAFSLCSRRCKAFHKAAQELFGPPFGDYKRYDGDMQRFMEANPEV